MMEASVMPLVGRRAVSVEVESNQDRHSGRQGNQASC
jgi:hypothetical protein